MAKLEKQDKMKKRKLPLQVSKTRYKELRILILGHLSESFALEVAPLSEDEVLRLVTKLKQEHPSLPPSDLIRKAHEDGEADAKERAGVKMNLKKREALKELLFSHGADIISLDLFLRRLLPEGTGPAKRREIFDGAFSRIPQMAGWSGYLEFHWPESNRLEALTSEPEVGLLIEQQKERLKGGVDLELAVVFGPLILAWHQFASSPRTRGSLGHDSARRRLGRQNGAAESR